MKTTFKEFAEAPDQPTLLPPDAPTWQHFLRNPIVRFLLFLIFTALTSVALVALMWTVPENPRAIVVSVLAPVAGYFATCVVAETRMIPFELHPWRSIQLLYGLGLGVFLLLLCFGVTVLFSHAAVQRAESVDWKQWWFAFFTSVVVAGIAEEILMRGVLFRFLEAAGGTWIAVLVSGAIFGGLHISNPNAMWWSAVSISLTAGIFFGLLYALTRSLWWVIGLHAAWNGMQGVILGLPVSGIDNPSIWQSTLVGNFWITGGDFGLEASVVTVVIFAVASGILAWLVVRTGKVFAPAWWQKKRRKALREQKLHEQKLRVQNLRDERAAQENLADQHPLAASESS